jgi:hypothetical protein
MQVYIAKVKDFVFGAYRPTVFGEMRPAGLCFHMELLAKLSFQWGLVRRQRLPGTTGFQLAAAKVWFQPGQNYGSRHTTCHFTHSFAQTEG